MDMKKEEMADAIIGVLYLASTCIGYIPAFLTGEYIHLGEWCCVTGIIGGIFYLASFFKGMKIKKMPELLHLHMTLVLILIFIATITVRLKLEGAFWFLHIFGPIFVLIRFFLFCDCRKIRKARLVLTSIIFPLGYIVSAFCLLKLTKRCPFPAGMILESGSLFMSLMIIAGLCAFILILGYGLFYLNRYFFNRRSKYRDS